MVVDMIELKTLKFLQGSFLEPIFVPSQSHILHILILQCTQFLADRMETGMGVSVIGIR